MNDKEALDAFKEKHYLTDDDLEALKAIKIPQSVKFKITDRPTMTFGTGCVRKKRRMRRKNQNRLGRCGI